MFSATPFSEPAQQYAYAHDIVLVPLKDNILFRPVTQAIRVFEDVVTAQRVMSLGDIRATSRSRLLGVGQERGTTDDLDEALSAITRAIQNIGEVYLARTRGGLPLFLVTSGDDATWTQMPDQPMRVRYQRNEGWWIESPEWGTNVRFSFDLPQELLRVFDPDGRLNPLAALRMKTDHFDEVHAYRHAGGRFQTLILKLDRSWIEGVRAALDQPETG